VPIAVNVALIVVNVALTVGPIAAVAGVLIAVSRRRRQPVLSAPAPEGSLVLHGRALRPDQLMSISGQLDDHTYGWLVITPADLRWEPLAGQPWAVPLEGVTVLGTTGAIALGPPGVDVTIADSGRWRLVVSHRPINRFARNDVKRFGEARTADQVAALLASRSAGHAGPPPPA
jgi:hypothetical protein